MATTRPTIALLGALLAGCSAWVLPGASRAPRARPAARAAVRLDADIELPEEEYRRQSRAEEVAAQVLAARLARELKAAAESADWDGYEMDADELRARPSVWALLFNPGSENEGIYSRRIGEDGTDLVLTFEEMDDADQYAALLSGVDFPHATSVEVPTETLLAFCDGGGHRLAMVRRGQLIAPPEQHVEVFEWSPGVSEEGASIEADGDEALAAQRRALEQMMGADDVDEGE